MRPPQWPEWLLRQRLANRTPTTEPASSGWLSHWFSKPQQFIKPGSADDIGQRAMARSAASARPLPCKGLARTMGTDSRRGQSPLCHKPAGGGAGHAAHLQQTWLLLMALHQSPRRQNFASLVVQSGQAASKRSLHALTISSQNFGRAAFGVVLLASCLHVGAAQALSFNFSFNGTGSPTSPATVTGTVSGLVDNLNDQTTGLTVTITSATNTPVGGWPTFIDANYQNGDGFDVSGGLVTGVNISYASLDNSKLLFLGNQGGIFGYPLSLRNSNSTIFNTDSRTSANSLIFTAPAPAPASVPGPLPLFGAGAAFGWSRRLRSRIKTPV